MPANPFDALAPTYDDDFTRSPIAQHLRARVHARLDKRIDAGERALELGCGTGEDALYLAQRGVHITATDASPAMLTAARAKLAGCAHARVEPLDLAQQMVLGASDPTPNLQLVFANFGVLNCLSDWRPLASWLAQIVAPGGHVAFGVMGPICLWEIGWHTLHGEWGVALRRFGVQGSQFTVQGSGFGSARVSSTDGSAQNSEPRTQNPASQTANGEPSTVNPIPIHYPHPRRLTRDFAPWFRRVHIEPLGLLLPPSDIYGAVERRPRLLRALIALDDRLGRWPPLAAFADHYWVEFKRTSEPAQ